MLNNWFKKEKPFAGFAGFGGGATGLGFAGGGGGVEATGGIKYWNSSENGGTMYHIFQSPGTFNVTTDGDVEVLIVGGGGSGADGQAGGGGGGGVVHGATIPVTGSIPIVVGAGGEPNGPGGNYNRCGYRGGSSSFNGVTAIGGGGGARNNYAWGGLGTDDQNRVSGANCGGGGGGSLSGSGQHFPSAAILPQPVPGSYVAYGGNYGAPQANVGSGSGGGGGGAGANSPGPAGPRPTSVRSPGGAGKAIPSFNSTNIPIMPSSWITAVGPTGLYGGGGGGGEDGPAASGFGGPGGGGDGQSPSSYPAAGAVAFTGGGGGDRGAPNLPHGSTVGAKGLVVVKYQSALTSDVGSTFGGQPYTIGNYTYHVFSAGDSSLFVDSGPVTYDILVVAGGGAGGSDRAAGACGGGGGGGVIYAENQTMGPGSYNVFVGSGGAYQPGAPSPNPKGDNGGNSVFSNVSIPGPAKVDMSGHSMPGSTWLALGGGGGAGSGSGNANITGREAGTGGGGGSQTGGGGGGIQTTQSSLPSISRTHGSGNAGRASLNAYPARGGGGGGHSPNTYGQGNENQGGRDGYQVPASFLPTSVPADFANLLGANHPTPKGGGIATNSPEWRYFAGGGGASDNVPATANSYQASGGLGGGGNAGGDGRPSPSNPRTARTGTTYNGTGNESSPGVHGRGGGGAANGLDNAGQVDYFGGIGGDGIIIVRIHNS